MNLSHYKRPVTCKGETFHFAEQTYVMGILNVTPDSFSDGGQFNEQERAVARAKEMLEEGATIIDVGGESTRPGHAPVSVEEEIERIVPIIEALTEELNCVISVDTYKATVARRAIEAGASIINDIWGGQKDPDMLRVAAEKNVPIVLMHNREEAVYPNGFEEDYFADMEKIIRDAKEAGIPDEHIWLDPGIGFAKSQEQNLEAMRLLPTLVQYGYPVLLGTSRKSMIGYVLDVPVGERLAGSLATVSYGAMNGCHIMRVHDVKETMHTTKMIDRLQKGAL